MGKGVWVGVKACGCYVAVVRDDGDPERAADVRQSQNDFLDEGLSVVYATEDEWREKYLPFFLHDCPHKSAPAVSGEPS